MSENNEKNSFIPLHCHSYYSLLDGLSSPKKLVERAVENGFKALAITDHGCCGGLLVFQKACKDAGIKPILGCEMYITDNMAFKEKTSINSHLILLAKNDIGLKNLMRLSSIAEVEGKYRHPRIDFSILEKHHDGLICSSACPNGELSKLIFNDKMKDAEELALKYKSLFGEDYYIEVMRHEYNEKEKEQGKKEYDLSIKLYELGKKLGIKVIATNDTHYAKKDDSKYHDILLSIQTIDTVKNPERFTFNSTDFYMKSYSEMIELFKDMPDVVTNTVEIADKVEEGLLKKSDDLLPVFAIPEGFASEKDYLKELVRDGMKSKGLINKPEYRERIRFEMDLIIKCDFVRYFLILWDVLNFAKREGISVGIGRGSAGGSLCLYVLGITGLDPIKYNLLFERFINPERVSPPDVDIDFEYFRRDEVVDYVYRKYGKDHCAKIGTFNALKSRAAIRGVSKALDLGRDWETYQEQLKRAKVDPVTGKKEKVELESDGSLKIADFLAKLVPFGPDVSIDSALK
jgi:DNA polymerase-3 subunit alpha